MVVLLCSMLSYYFRSRKKKKANRPAKAEETVKAIKYTWLEKYPKKKVVINPAAKLEREYKSWKIPAYLPLFGSFFMTYLKYPP
jgi:hypothetical protein